MQWQEAVIRCVNDMSAELVDLASTLIGIASVGGSAQEQAAQHVVADWLEQHGLRVSRAVAPVDEAAPGFPGMEVARAEVVLVIGRLLGTGAGRDLLLLGHTDVVPADTPSQFAPRLLDGRLIGRGASDMKSGVAAMCVAAAALARSGVALDGSVLVAPVSAEEDGGAGTFTLLQRHDLLQLAPGSAAIIPEPTRGAIITGNAGSLTFRLTVKGRSAHGALRWQGVNPLDHLQPVLDALHRLESERCAHAGDAFAGWPMAYPISIGTINGGDWASTVPAQVELTGRYGVRIGESLEQARRDFEQAVACACDQDQWLRDHPVEVTWWGAQFESAATPADEAIVASLQQAGVCGPVGAAPYGSDLRLLVKTAGLPCVQFGPGDPALAHSEQESVSIDDMLSCARTLALTAGSFCGVAEPLVDNR